MRVCLCGIQSPLSTIIVRDLTHECGINILDLRRLKHCFDVPFNYHYYYIIIIITITGVYLIEGIMCQLDN